MPTREQVLSAINSGKLPKAGDKVLYNQDGAIVRATILRWGIKQAHIVATIATENEPDEDIEATLSELTRIAQNE